MTLYVHVTNNNNAALPYGHMLLMLIHSTIQCVHVLSNATMTGKYIVRLHCVSVYYIYFVYYITYL